MVAGQSNSAVLLTVEPTTPPVLGRLLIVYDPRQGPVTADVRGFAFKADLLQRGWQVEFLDYTPMIGRERTLAQLTASFDLVYLLKVPSRALLSAIRRVSQARIIFDLTDALWLPHFRKGVWKDLDSILSSSDAVFCCNRFDSAYAGLHNSAVFCIPPFTPVEDFDRCRESGISREIPPVVIGWVGSTSTASAIRHVAEALERVGTENPGVQLRIVGCKDGSVLPAFKNISLSLGPGAYNKDDMVREILAMDIGLFPVVNGDEDYKARGSLKAMNYMAGRIPVVCQNLGECARMLVDGESGMLATTVDEWARKLTVLVKDRALRTRMGQAGYEIVKTSYTHAHAASALDQSLRSVLSTPARRTFSQRLTERLLSWRGR